MRWGRPNIKSDQTKANLDGDLAPCVKYKQSGEINLPMKQRAKYYDLSSVVDCNSSVMMM